MERQCFEVESIAAEMNERFINIKVDREERPDVDQLYMTAIQVLTRQRRLADERVSHARSSAVLWRHLFSADRRARPAGVCHRPHCDRAIISSKIAERGRKGATSTHRNPRPNRRARPAGEAIEIDAKFIDTLMRRSTGDYESDVTADSAAAPNSRAKRCWNCCSPTPLSASLLQTSASSVESQSGRSRNPI